MPRQVLSLKRAGVQAGSLQAERLSKVYRARLLTAGKQFCRWLRSRRGVYAGLFENTTGLNAVLTEYL